MVLSQLSAIAAPRQFESLTLDAAVARTDVAIKLSGFGFAVLHQGMTDFRFRLNEPDSIRISFDSVNYVRHPFHTIYISNDVGVGILELLIFKSEGVDLGLRGYGLDEVVSRQGAATSYLDRQGNVLFSDIIADGLMHLGTVTNGTGAAIAIVTASSSQPVSRIGAQSIEIKGGSDDDQYSLVYHNHLLPFGSESGLLGFEATFSMDAHVDFGVAGFEIFDGQLVWSYAVRIERNTKKVGIFKGPRDVDVSGAAPWAKGTDAEDSYLSTTLYPNHTGISIANGERMFHTVKLVIDLAAKTYHRVAVNGVPIDSSSIVSPSLTRANTASPHIYGYVASVSEAGQNGDTYLDNYILTMNEPRILR